MSNSTLQAFIDDYIDQRRPRFSALSDAIWDHPETRFNETYSATLLADALEQEGFSVEHGVGDIETAFIASYGSGHPVIALLGEYDALAGLSQQAGRATPQPLVENGNGHGCGHNLLGTAALAGAFAAKAWMQQNRLTGTLRFYGCPGEEGGSGKTFMVREGLFDDVDAALTWHPEGFSGMFNTSTLANIQAAFHFKGVAAHAANSPHLGRSALDAVTEAVRLLEECPLFNAGKGSVFTHQGTHELDACVMDGRTCDAGAVAGVSRIRNPVLAARAVLENSEHVLFAAEGAEKFAAAHGLEMVAPDFFFTQERFDQLHRAQAEQGRVLLDHDGAAQAGDPLDPDRKFGTVGAVALDALGNLAAATSTGGMTNKQAGRVGDTPIIGAGCYANNATVAVSSTGTGEIFMRGVAAYDVSALIEYGDLSLQAASDRVVMEKLPALGGSGGMIAVDRHGNIALPFNCEGMYRGFGYVGDAPSVGIYR